MKRKKTTLSGSSKKKPTQTVNSPANRNPSSPQKPAVPSQQKAPPTQQRSKSQSTVRSKLSAHKGSGDVTRSIKTQGDSSAHDMSGTTLVTGQSRHLIGDSPVQDEANEMSPPSHAPHFHTSQLQPSQPLRRFENKKNDDMFSLEKKRRRLSSMNTAVMRRSSVSASPLTPENKKQSSTEPTRTSDKDHSSLPNRSPGAPSKGKTTREILSKKHTILQHNEKERVGGKEPKTESKPSRDLGSKGGKKKVSERGSKGRRGSYSDSESDEEPVVRKPNTVKPTKVLKSSVKDQRSNSQTVTKRNISSVLSSDSDDEDYMDGQPVSNNKVAPPEAPPTIEQPSSTLWKADGMLNSSSSSGNDTSDFETENVSKKSKPNDKVVRKTKQRLSDSNRSESDDDDTGNIPTNSRGHVPHRDKPTASSNKKDHSVKRSRAIPSSSMKKEVKRSHKRKGVFSDSDSEDSDGECGKRSSKDASAYTVGGFEDHTDKQTRKSDKKGYPLPERGISFHERGNTHVEHKDMSGGSHRNSKSDQSNESVNSLKRPFERDKLPSFEHQNSMEDSSANKKLRLVDIDFTGGKMRAPPTQNTHKVSSSKLTPLKKLRIQSQKHHHGLMSNTLHHKLNKTKTTYSKTNSSKPGEGIKDRASDKTAERGISSTLTHKPHSPDKGHSLSRSYSTSSNDPHKSPSTGHKSRKNGKNDMSKKATDLGRELFAQKDAILAAKFPQKRKLVPEHTSV